MHTFSTREQYIEYLSKQAEMPDGFLCSTTALEFFPHEKPVPGPLKMNMSLILAEKETPLFAAMFTKNLFPGAPVVIGRERRAGKVARGILINNRISNVCTESGVSDALSILDTLAQALGARPETLFPASTGIIGWKLPLEEMKKAIPKLVYNLGKRSILDVAQAIMTTDSYPKLRHAKAGEGTVTGIAKGAGMIEPNLATMLVFILTDLDVPRELLQSTLERCVRRSFNRISVDSDQSTSDSVFILSSASKKPPPGNAFEDALAAVCDGLATDVVRNGEGTSHVIRVNVTGNASEGALEGIGKAIVNSPLVKTAIYGNDPNVGRIVSSIGDYLGNSEIQMDTRAFTIRMSGIEIFKGAAFKLDATSEKKLTDYLLNTRLEATKEKGFPPHELVVDIDVETGGGSRSITVFGSDLSHEYISENADYRS